MGDFVFTHPGWGWPRIELQVFLGRSTFFFFVHSGPLNLPETEIANALIIGNDQVAILENES